jgi:hypothetical protein
VLESAQHRYDTLDGALLFTEALVMELALLRPGSAAGEQSLHLARRLEVALREARAEALEELS